MLVDAGFSTGMVVKRKQDELQGTIRSMSATLVTLELEDGTMKTAQATSFLQGLWKEVKAQQQDPVEVVGYPGKEIQKSIFTSMIKGRIFLALSQKWDQPDSVKLFTKPRGVFALKSFRAKSLKMPLITSKVELRTNQREPSLGYVCVGKCEQEQQGVEG